MQVYIIYIMQLLGGRLSDASISARRTQNLATKGTVQENAACRKPPALLPPLCTLILYALSFVFANRTMHQMYCGK